MMEYARGELGVRYRVRIWGRVASVCIISLLAGAISLALFRPAFAQTNVTGTMNIYGAGHLTAPGPGGNGGGVLPVEVAIPTGTGRTVQFGFSGTVDYGPCCPPNGPDGAAFTGVEALPQYGGLAGCDFPSRGHYLVGVFLDDSEPADPPPDSLVLPDGSFLDLFPDLRQIFFVGDGLTGEGSGTVQTFHIPDTATRLFLGFSDRCSVSPNVPGWYDDNSGTVSGTVTFSTAVGVGPERLPGLQPLRNHPNPFLLFTTLTFSTNAAAYYDLRIYDVRGRLVRTLLSASVGSGGHNVSWDGRDQGGRAVKAGIYYGRLRGPSSVEICKLLLLGD